MNTSPIAETSERESVIRELIDRVFRRTMAIDFTWSWPGGVAFYGISRAWEATGKAEYIETLKKWVDEYIEIGVPSLNVNTIALGHTLISLHEASGDDKYMDLALRKVDYLQKEALRFGEGVLQHTVSPKNDFPEQAWADTLFMAAYFQLRMGFKTGNKAWIDDSLKQWFWHEEFLQDDTSNLYYHGWDNIAKNHMSSLFWARGNAWAAYTMAQALQYINYLYPMYMRIEGSLRDQLSALVRLQSPEGLWHTILTDPTSYCESSASAGIAAALAINAHPLHFKAVERAFTGITTQIAADGSVLNVSGGTAVMPDAEAYKAIPHKRVQGWGQGLTLAFLSALIKKSDNMGSSV